MSAWNAAPALNRWLYPAIRLIEPFHSLWSHAIIFGFDPGERLGFMLLGPATSNGAVGPGPQVNVNIVEMTRDIFIFAEGGHDVIAQC